MKTGAVLRDLPDPARPPSPTGRHAQRRRAADAGHRTSADVFTEAPDARRALTGDHAGHGGTALRGGRAPQPRRHDYPTGGTERAPGARTRPSRVCAPDRPNRATGYGTGPAQERPGP